MNDKLGFIFPGQGAQYVGMGKDFHDSFSIARHTFEEASDLLLQNMKELILHGPESVLSQTQHSQPAIFITSVAILRVLGEEMPHLVPAVCAGLSLGEYTALLASDKISFDDCLKLVAARALFMQKACEEKEGVMRVVLGLEPEVIRKHLPSDVWVANINCPGQVVIAGIKSAMPLAEEALKAQGARRLIPLQVSGAFHTPLMRSAQRELEPKLRSVNLKESDTRLVMNVSGDFATSLEEIRRNLIAQVASTTYWAKGIISMNQAGVSCYIEMGPGKTLAGMNRNKERTLSIEKVVDLKLLEELSCNS